MTTRRLLIPTVLAATAALAPAAAAQQPTLAFDRPCYAEDQRMVFSGSGYTPGGDVELTFTKAGAAIGTFGAVADPAGALANFVVAHEDQVLADGEERETITATAADGANRSTPASFTFTRWAGFSPGRYVPGRRVEVEAYGWAFAAGKPLYLHFQKGRTTVKSVRAGVLSAGCGDLVARVRVPKLKAGSYRLVLATQKRAPAGLYTWRKGRVVKRAAASAARRQPMRRAG